MITPSRNSFEAPAHAHTHRQDVAQHGNVLVLETKTVLASDSMAETKERGYDDDSMAPNRYTPMALGVEEVEDVSYVGVELLSFLTGVRNTHPKLHADLKLVAVERRLRRIPPSRGMNTIQRIEMHVYWGKLLDETWRSCKIPLSPSRSAARGNFSPHPCRKTWRLHASNTPSDLLLKEGGALQVQLPTSGHHLGSL